MALKESPRKPSLVRVDNIIAKLVNPVQISLYQNAILMAIVAGTGGVLTMSDTASIQRVLQMLHNGTLHFWAFLAPGDRPALVGGMSAHVSEDVFGHARALTILSFYAAQVVTMEAWKSLGSEFVQFARNHECSRIVGITNNPRVVKVAEQLGFTQDRVIMVKEVS
mgnify:FL=1